MPKPDAGPPAVWGWRLLAPAGRTLLVSRASTGPASHRQAGRTLLSIGTFTPAAGASAIALYARATEGFDARLAQTLDLLRAAVAQTRDMAYAHHIQRLMITGNFALLAGVAPAQIEDWYLAVYADAFEWVELPNVHGMVMHADGGRLGSKPYAASGAYINRMSDYCTGCAFDPKQKLGARACPFNYLYWNFLIENEATLARNPRMALPYRTLAKMPADQRQAIIHASAQFLAGQAGWSPPAQLRLDDGW